MPCKTTSSRWRSSTAIKGPDLGPNYWPRWQNDAGRAITENYRIGRQIHKSGVVPVKAGIHFGSIKKTLDSRSVTKMSGNDELEGPSVTHLSQCSVDPTYPHRRRSR